MPVLKDNTASIIWMVTLESRKIDVERYTSHRAPRPNFARYLLFCRVGNIGDVFITGPPSLHSSNTKNTLPCFSDCVVFLSDPISCRCLLKWVFGVLLCCVFCSCFKAIFIFCSAWARNEKVLFRSPSALVLNTSNNSNVFCFVRKDFSFKITSFCFNFAFCVIYSSS